MLDASRIYLWAWDARPFPAFPLRKDLWRDGDNWLLGHWLNGRLSGAAVADLVSWIVQDFGGGSIEVRKVGGAISGYIVPDPTSARRALEPLIDLFGLSFRSVGGTFLVSGEDARESSVVEIDDFVVDDGGAVLTRVRQPDHEFHAETVLAFTDPLNEYQAASARRLHSDAPHDGQDYQGFPGAMDPALAESLLADRTRRRWLGREEVRFALPQTRIDVGPGTIVRVDGGAGPSDYLVTGCDVGLTREISARRLRSVAPAPWRATVTGQARQKVTRAGPPLALFLDLPLTPGNAEPRNAFKLALRAKPWIAHAAYVSPGDSGFDRRALVSKEATVGTLDTPLAPGFQGRFYRAGALDVTLYSGELASVADLNLFNGANAAAVRAANGEWEILQFASAEEVAPLQWRLTRLLRGQQGTGTAMAAGAAAGAYFVLLDDAVTTAGIGEAEVGLSLNWKVGPLGADFAGPAFASATLAGGNRARTPIAPVHLDLSRLENGDCLLSWVRRSRISGDISLSGSVPLGEESEAYLVSIAEPGGAALRIETVSSPEWLYDAAAIAVDFGSMPDDLEFTVRQISGSVGPGDPAVKVFQLS
jgi:hypothetical protein